MKIAPTLMIVAATGIAASATATADTKAFLRGSQDLSWAKHENDKNKGCKGPYCDSMPKPIQKNKDGGTVITVITHVDNFTAPNTMTPGGEPCDFPWNCGNFNKKNTTTDKTQEKGSKRNDQGAKKKNKRSQKAKDEKESRKEEHKQVPTRELVPRFGPTTACS